MLTYILTREEIGLALTAAGKIRYSFFKSLYQSILLGLACALNIYFCALHPTESVYYAVSVASGLFAVMVWAVPLYTRKNQIDAAYTGDKITLVVDETRVRVKTKSGESPWEFTISSALNYSIEEGLIIIKPVPGKIFIIPIRIIEEDNPLVALVLLKEAELAYN